MARSAFQDLNRLRQIARVVARHGFGAYLERTRLGDLLGRKAAAEAARVAAEEAGEPSAADRRTAARFCRMLVDLGPTFIKLGQLLSSRPDILPSHWIEELSKLQDSCPPLPIAEIRAQIERALGRPVPELFAELSEEPLASASIAQVHRARTHASAEVAVKVQRPDVRQRIEGDLSLLYYLARLLEAVVEETGIYTPTGIVEEFDRAIHEEMDFGNEARNVRDMAAASAGIEFLAIPGVHEDLSSGTVLTLDFVAGVKVADITGGSGYDPELVARRIIEIAFRQLFEKGIFHGDPHPGNILVLPGNRIALLDFGLVGRLSRSMQEALVTLIMAVALRDPETVARVLYRVGVPPPTLPSPPFATTSPRFWSATWGSSSIRSGPPHSCRTSSTWRCATASGSPRNTRCSPRPPSPSRGSSVASIRSSTCSTSACPTPASSSSPASTRGTPAARS